MNHEKLVLNGDSLNIVDLTNVARNKQKVTISENALQNLKAAQNWVQSAIDNKQVIYGITTGFGQFKNVTIDPDQVVALQENLVRSHACGVGEPLKEDQVRASILVRINSLIKGYSGIRREVIDALVALLNNDIYPYVPSQGSVGSSGDLAPLCHIILVLLGEGECLQNGNRVPSSAVLREKGLNPITLHAKEGLALSNGTSVQTGIGALATYDAAILIDSADLIAALSVEVLMGSRAAFNPLIHKARNQKGQIKSAENLFALLQSSPIIDSHVDCDRIQDSYSLRCIPQIHGAIRDAFEYSKSVIERELNAATDNPLIFPQEDIALSGGNFHGEPIAIAMDTLGIALSELANISERRLAKMVDPATSEGLPAFLTSVNGGGLNNGLMIVQYTAAALVSENKVLAHPASVDSIPTSANQEDHVSMGTIAARKAVNIANNVKNVLAIELFSAAQAYEFRKPAQLSPSTLKLYTLVRDSVPAVEKDRVYYKDFETIVDLILNKEVTNIASQSIPSWNHALNLN